MVNLSNVTKPPDDENKRLIRVSIFTCAYMYVQPLMSLKINPNQSILFLIVVLSSASIIIKFVSFSYRNLKIEQVHFKNP